LEARGEIVRTAGLLINGPAKPTLRLACVLDGTALCACTLLFVVNLQTNLHGWRIQKVSGEYQCSVLTGQLFLIITPSHEGGLCRMDFAAYRQEVAWTTYGVKNITVLDEPIYSPGTERYL